MQLESIGGNLGGNLRSGDTPLECSGSQLRSTGSPLRSIRSKSSGSSPLFAHRLGVLGKGASFTHRAAPVLERTPPPSRDQQGGGEGDGGGSGGGGGSSSSSSGRLRSEDSRPLGTVRSSSGSTRSSGELPSSTGDLTRRVHTPATAASQIQAVARGHQVRRAYLRAALRRQMKTDQLIGRSQKASLDDSEDGGGATEGSHSPKRRLAEHHRVAKAAETATAQAGLEKSRRVSAGLRRVSDVLLQSETVRLAQVRRHTEGGLHARYIGLRP